MGKRKFNVGAVIMLVLMAVVATFNITFYVAANYFNSRFGDLTQLENKYAKLNEVASVVDKYFIAEYDYDAALDAAMAGYVAGLGDQWSGYYTAEQTRQITEDKENTYEGIGVTINGGEENPYMIVKVSSGGPADTAGVVVQDVITHVDGVAVADIGGQTDVVNKVRGPQGTTVRVTIDRGGQTKVFDIVRAPVHNEKVTARMLDGNIGYIHIDGFDKNVDTEFSTKLDSLISQGACGFIFDVRMNPGGQVSVMVNILDRLLPEGRVISMKDNLGKEEYYNSDAAWINMPMVVLVNERSISAAEFFGAALQEYAVADIVGVKTTGKGYAQSLFFLSDGSSINLSVMRYYTPKGISLAGEGITPDYEVDLSDEAFYNFYNLEDAEDTQLQKAIEVLSKKMPVITTQPDNTTTEGQDTTVADTTAAAG